MHSQPGFLRDMGFSLNFSSQSISGESCLFDLEEDPAFESSKGLQRMISDLEDCDVIDLEDGGLNWSLILDFQ